MDKETEKKDFYFSYDNIRRTLRRQRRMFGAEKFKGISVFDMLLQMLHDEEIGNYDEVEWRTFNISVNTFDVMVKAIEFPDEVARVFTYFSEHAKDILPETSTRDQIEDFEYECDCVVSRVVKENPPNIKGGPSEDKPYLRMIAANFSNDVELDEKDKIIFSHMWKPADYEYTNLFPFEAIYFAAQSTSGRMRMDVEKFSMENIESGDYELPKIETYVPYIRLCLSTISYRPAREHKEPIIQSLFVISFFARELALGKDPYAKIMREISDGIIKYVREKYFIDIRDSVNDAVVEWHDYMMKAITTGVRKELERAEKLGEIERESDENEALEESSFPSTSFFKASNNISNEMCRNELIRIINESKYKSSACVAFMHPAASIYFNFVDKTDQGVADLINPWVQQTRKKWIFKADDFRKARNKKVK